MTILELSKELKVSKTAVRKHITAEFRKQYIENVDGTLQISENGCELLRESFRKRSENNSENHRKQAETVSENLPQTEVFAEMLTVLREQLAEKDRQIEALQTALTETTSALQAAQALHAGTIQKQLEQPKIGLFRRLFKKTEQTSN